MRIQPFLVIPIVLSSWVGCGRKAEDASKVLANVGGTKITDAELGKLVRALIKDPVQANEFLSKDDKRAERKALLEQMATSKAVFQLAQVEGLDKDSRVQAQIESATAQVYFNSLLERRAGKLVPTEADLKALYDRKATQAKLQGQENIPPFEDRLKPTLEAAWQQQQQQRMVEGLQKELQEKVPMIFVEDGVGKK